MGEIIEIEEQTGSFRFRICFTPTGERREVTVDPDKEQLFSSQDNRSIRSMACPFLRIRSPDRATCSVHSSRPEICRQYSCSRIPGPGNRGK